MTVKFYDINANYKTAMEQARTRIALEIADSVRLIMQEVKLSQAAIDSMTVEMDWDIKQLDDGCVEWLGVSITFDATDHEPTLVQGSRMEELLEQVFNPFDDEGDPIVYNNEPYIGDDGKLQHLIEFELDVA